ncbi:MAG TPA: glycosyltransferase family 39 protein [Chloroflexia bacterium]|nr:glycosyltransferase family 39 protein [Chloroflexia bacterium]
MGSAREVLDFLGQWQDHTPLAYLLTWSLRGLGGSEAAVRLPFALAGALNVPAMYLLGKAVGGSRVGLAAALFLAIAPFTVFYSQEARPYTLMMLFGTLQALFALQAVRRGAARYWLALAGTTVLLLYTGYLSFACSAPVAAFICVVLLLETISGLRRSPLDVRQAELRRVARQWFWAAATAALVLLCYLPWIPSFIAFTQNPGIGFNRLPKGYEVQWHDVQTLFEQLGLTDLWLALVAIGIVTGIVWVARRRLRREGLLLLLWPIAPVVGFWLYAGEATLKLEVRYFSFVYLGCVLLLAVGLDSAASLLARLRAPLAWSSRAAFAVCVLLLVARTTPALAASYEAPKRVPTDYRQVARHIISQSPAGSLVLVLGMWGIKPEPPSVVGVDGLHYYFWLYNADITVVDGSRLTESIVSRVESQNGAVWGAVYSWMPGQAPFAGIEEAGLHETEFQGVALLRARQPQPIRDQVNTLLRVATPAQPGLVATRSLVDPSFQRSGLGPNILAPARSTQLPVAGEDPLSLDITRDRWLLWPGTALRSRADGFTLSPSSKSQVNVTLTTDRIVPGRLYVMRFRCGAQGLSGEQRVYVSLYARDGQFLETFPWGAGFPCSQDEGESARAFALKTPDSVGRAVIWLRATGTGTATYADVEMREVLEKP